jgi:hypothetical protein
MSMPVVKIKGISLDLAGQLLVVPPLSLGAMEQLQDSLASFTGDISDRKQVATAIDAAHAALRRNYPEMTREDVAELVDVSNMVDVFQAVMDVSGARRKAAEAQALEGQEGNPPGEA